MNISSKPLYIHFVVGYPDAPYHFFPQAAKELGINLKIEYHGCIIHTLYKDDLVLITDAGVETLRIQIENEAAEIYYILKHGKNWIDKVKNRALQIYDESDEADLPF